MPRILRVVVPILVVALAIGGAVVMVKSKPVATRQAPAITAPRVVVARAIRQDLTPTIATTGVVRAAREVNVSAELNGRVTWVSSSFVVGGRVKKGDLLFRLDERDFVLLVEEAKARVSQAELALTLEKNQGEIAKREFGLLSDGKIAAERRAIALREPQRQNAEVQLQSAKNALERSEHALSRTSVRAPFDAVVSNERVEVGQLAGPGASLGTLIGTESAWVFASLPVENLRAVRIGEGEVGAVASVQQILANGSDEARAARVIRLAAELEPDTRAAQVIIEVKRPFDPQADGLPLLPGAFVNVAITADTKPGVIVIPRLALIDDDEVWIVNADDMLERRALDVEWRDRQVVVVRQGLSEGDRVVTTPMPNAMSGQKVKPTESMAPSSTTGTSSTTSGEASAP